MQTTSPKVSIGLPVYNGEDYLKEAIDSILAQTYIDFELIITDNASTDRTAEICQAYAAQDKRIHYHRNPTNIGGANNHNLTVELSRGQYFRWAADDDLFAPTLLEKCVAALDANPNIVLCYTKIVQIDEYGNRVKLLDRTFSSSDRPHERFWELSKLDHLCETIYGVIRTEVLRRTGLMRNYTDQDRTLLCHLSLLGKFHMIPEPLFYKRIHPGMSTNEFLGWRERMVWFDDANKDRITFPHWLQFFHYLEVIGDVAMPRSERLRCYLLMGRWLKYGKRWRKMMKDIYIADKKIFKKINNNLLSNSYR